MTDIPTVIIDGETWYYCKLNNFTERDFAEIYRLVECWRGIADNNGLKYHPGGVAFRDKDDAHLFKLRQS
ncbi:hypothetical protein [Ferrovibrio sp.]|uniref:hypothetical protein n=1 Tax=Ferrovibrio sp. TaxID=1917215 RepID=UPI0025C35780|nr:hypothetical protein [Ferrovibrio sp.]